jgi:hypothetical protein
VILRHSLPDGSWHADWLLDLPSPDPARVPTFRCAERPDTPTATFWALRLADHRRMYLDYEGPVSGGRGSVVRMARGVILSAEGWPGPTRLRADFGRGPRAWLAQPDTEGRWRFTPS